MHVHATVRHGTMDHRRHRDYVGHKQTRLDIMYRNIFMKINVSICIHIHLYLCVCVFYYRIILVKSSYPMVAMALGDIHRHNIDAMK